MGKAKPKAKPKPLASVAVSGVSTVTGKDPFGSGEEPHHLTGFSKEYTALFREHVQVTYYLHNVSSELGCVRAWEASLLFDNLSDIHQRLGEMPTLSDVQRKLRAALTPALRQVEKYWVPREGTQAASGDEHHGRKEAKMSADELAELMPFKKLLEVLLDIAITLTADQEEPPAPVPAVTKSAAAAAETGTHPTVAKAAAASRQDALGGGEAFVLTPAAKSLAADAFLNPLNGLGGGGRSGGGGSGGGSGGGGGGTSTGDGAPAQSGAPPTRFPPSTLPNIRGDKKPVLTRRERPGLGIDRACHSHTLHSERQQHDRPYDNHDAMMTIRHDETHERE
jgi:hypothetical protein